MPMPMPMPFMPPPMFMHPDMMSAYGYAPFDYRKRPRDWDAGNARRRRRHDNKVRAWHCCCCARGVFDSSTWTHADSREPGELVSVDMRYRMRSTKIDCAPSLCQVCSNCQTNSTPFWRKDRHDGSPLCNACGLYYAKNEAHRPKVSWSRACQRQWSQCCAAAVVTTARSGAA
jgi:hypothetical protein